MSISTFIDHILKPRRNYKRFDAYKAARLSEINKNWRSDEELDRIEIEIQRGARVGLTKINYQINFNEINTEYLIDELLSLGYECKRDVALGILFIDWSN